MYEKRAESLLQSLVNNIRETSEQKIQVQHWNIEQGKSDDVNSNIIQHQHFKLQQIGKKKRAESIL